MKIKIGVADDHNIVLEGLQAILGQYDDIQIDVLANNGREMLEMMSTTKLDIVILDINMPDMDGLSCAKIIKKRYPSVKIIILTMYGQFSFVEEIIKIGVDGCILKNNTGKELYQAIQRVCSGKSYYDSIQSFNKSDDTETLGKREIEIVKLISEGLNSRQIGERLFISEHTVKTHRRNILRKTGISTTSELLKYALNAGII